MAHESSHNLSTLCLLALLFIHSGLAWFPLSSFCSCSWLLPECSFLPVSTWCSPSPFQVFIKMSLSQLGTLSLPHLKWYHQPLQNTPTRNLLPNFPFYFLHTSHHSLAYYIFYLSVCSPLECKLHEVRAYNNAWHRERSQYMFVDWTRLPNISEYQ